MRNIDPEPGWLIDGRYRVATRIGSGGMAEVFRAHDEVLGRDVAVKVFRAAPARAGTTLGIERQRTELHVMARLNHPNLITLYDGSVTSTPGYLVLELVNGPALSERIARGPLPEAQVRSLAIQIADALAYVHAHGLVHRDVKPANILVEADPAESGGLLRARLSDFGIVQILGADRLTSVNLTVGSASYLAPEQARGLAVGPAADIYALALVLMEAFTGARPFYGTPLEVMSARVARRPEIPAPLPNPWPNLLAAMTAMDPADRPSASAVAQALRSGHTLAPTPIATAAEATALIAGVSAPSTDAAVTDTPTGRTIGIAPGGVAAASAGIAGDQWQPRRRRLGLLAGILAVVSVGGAALLLRAPGFSGDPAPPAAPAATDKSTASVPKPRASQPTSQAPNLKATSAIGHPHRSSQSRAASHTTSRGSTPGTGQIPPSESSSATTAIPSSDGPSTGITTLTTPSTATPATPTGNPSGTVSSATVASSPSAAASTTSALTTAAP